MNRNIAVHILIILAVGLALKEFMDKTIATSSQGFAGPGQQNLPNEISSPHHSAANNGIADFGASTLLISVSGSNPN